MRMSWKCWDAVLWLCFIDLTLGSVGQATRLARVSLANALFMLAIAAALVFVRWTLIVYAISRIAAWVQRKRAAAAVAPTASPSAPG